MCLLRKSNKDCDYILFVCSPQNPKILSWQHEVMRTVVLGAHWILAKVAANSRATARATMTGTERSKKQFE